MEEEAAGGGSAAEPEVVEKDDDERELEKLEKSDPEMLRVCLIILEQLEKFKVRLIVERMNNLNAFDNIFSMYACACVCVCAFIILGLISALINAALA